MMKTFGLNCHCFGPTFIDNEDDEEQQSSVQNPTLIIFEGSPETEQTYEDTSTDADSLSYCTNLSTWTHLLY